MMVLFRTKKLVAQQQTERNFSLIVLKMFWKNIDFREVVARCAQSFWL